jgi:hypothetical protein
MTAGRHMWPAFIHPAEFPTTGCPSVCAIEAERQAEVLHQAGTQQGWRRMFMEFAKQWPQTHRTGATRSRERTWLHWKVRGGCLMGLIYQSISMLPAHRPISKGILINLDFATEWRGQWRTCTGGNSMHRGRRCDGIRLRGGQLMCCRRQLRIRAHMHRALGRVPCEAAARCWQHPWPS